MIRIDPTQDVIITYSPIPEITGHLFECFDYYLFLRNYYKVGILFIDSLSREQCKIAFESKYIFQFDDIVNDITFINKEQLVGNNIITFGKNTVVLLADGNIKSLEHRQIFLSTTKLIGFLCGVYDFEKVKINNRITFLQDYRIYGHNKNFKSFNYVKKLPFKYYKKSTKQFDNTGLMYVTYACRKITPMMIEEYHQMSGCTKTLLAVPYKLPEYDNIDGVIQMLAPIEDFFNKFDTYIYTPVARKFDCSPRLVTECFLQNKKLFLHLDYMDIGLQTRYDDCKNNFESLNLKESDDILKIIELFKSK